MAVARSLIFGAGIHRIAAPLPVLGESIVVLKNKASAGEISTRDLERAVERLGSWISETKLEVCGLGTTGESLSTLVSQVSAADRNLRPADLLIAASALGCPECQHLFTSDPDMLESMALQSLMASRGKSMGEAVGRATSAQRRRGRYGGRR